MRTLWKVLSWLFVICGISAFLVGWVAMLSGSSILVPTEMWFYDAIAAGIFGIFFLVYGAHVNSFKRK